MSRFDVIAAVGAPDRKFPPEVWLYWNCRSDDPIARQNSYDTMLLRFEHDRLVLKKLIASRDVRALLASIPQVVAADAAAPSR